MTTYLKLKRFTLIIPALIIFFIAVNGYSDTTRVLFIGNSYTYANNLPLIFSNLSASGNKNTVTDISAPGGYSFENHYSNPETISKIKMGNWNFVLLQEQSQMPVIPYYRFNFTYPYAILLDSIIKSYGQQTVFFVTWGREAGGEQCINSYCSPVFINYYHMQDSLTASYRMIADSVNALTAPAGEAWRIARTLNPLIDLWDSDGSHPSLKGSYLAACLFYKKLFNQSPAGLVYTAGLSTQDALFLQNCADLTVTAVQNQNSKHYANDFAEVYPNPVNSRAIIKFYIEKKAYCTIKLFDISGREIKETASGFFPAGENNSAIIMNDLSSGVYFVRLATESRIIVRRVVLIR